ncbi:SusC/RagA family TonB-linked outer membrane protein [Capnocytophaga sp. oral taxon 878]|uniref:SusC/RagA family TonB-linked outer membrane protein n=1 Tax=Capnocytophaga sp. oral taxon 878 TaxID=1316596 RepID=UPI000D040CFC|nr:SusC/RagA family TonB-linked outer membrane protein [Capnocytophaga sp. oral taxon 878]AVM50628.1 SusC/RagA family TonB-linked outer membrane protein [Capnocytophaga sp. oral taxon 878]
MNLKNLFVCISFLLLSATMVAQNLEVSGTVKDDKGLPLPGVLVLIKGTQNGASTDENGRYTVRAKAGDVLNFSFLGMQPIDKKVGGNTKKIDVVMSEEAEQLEEMIVTGYGAPKIASRTVAHVAQVQGKDVSSAPIASVSDALQGRLAGVVVTSGSGRPGSNSEILIHGYNNFQGALSKTGTQEPLFIMDGIAVSSSVMSDFNPNDIENITVLKDAASTSIYGARAANGVVLITTKKGRRNERTNITISNQLGFSALTNASRKFFDDMMTPREYMDFWLERSPSSIISAAGMSRLGNTREVAEAAANKILQDNPYNTQWDRFFFRDFVPLTRTDVSLSGGTESTSYYLSLGYFKQEGTSNPSSDYTRYTLNGSVSTQITKWLKTGISFAAGHNERDGSGSDSTIRMNTLPFYSPTYEDGRRKDYINSIISPSLGFYHPEYYAEKHPRSTISDDFMPSGFITIEPIKNLIFKTQGGVQYGYGDVENKELSSFMIYKQRTPAPTTNAYALFSSSRSLRKTLTNTLEYRFLLGAKKQHSFNALLGQESIENSSKTLTVITYGQPSDGLSTLSHGNKNQTVEDDKTTTTFNSYFGRLEYSYGSKYFLDLSIRRDGSSAFGKNNHYGNFWALGAMWKLKQENFLKDVNWLTDLNLRFSTGLSGNSGGGSYNHLTTIEGSDYYQQNMGYTIYRLGNPNLHWEEQRKTTVGVNVVIDRATSFNIEYYDRETYDMLSSRELNTTSGQNQFMDNAGGMRNRGVDFTFSSVVYRNAANDFTIRPYFNVNYNVQEITSLFGNKISDISTSSGVGYKLGRALEWAAVIRKGVNPTTGLTEYYVPGTDRMEQVTDDNNVTTSYDDSKLIQTTGKKMQAPVNGGFGWNINYKSFSLDMAFSFSLGRYVVNNDMRYVENPGRFGVYNMSRKVFDYWKQAGDNTRHPKVNSDAFIYSLDSRLIQDASYMRMKSISLSYRLPKKVIDQIGFFDGIRLYTTARNIFTLTKYEGADPESASAISLGGYPPSREFTLGIDINF